MLPGIFGALKGLPAKPGFRRRLISPAKSAIRQEGRRGAFVDDGEAVEGAGEHHIQHAAEEFILREVFPGGIADGDAVELHALDDGGGENHDAAAVIGIGLREEAGVQLRTEGAEKLAGLVGCFLDESDAVETFALPGKHLIPEEGEALFFIGGRKNPGRDDF